MLLSKSTSQDAMLQALRDYGPTIQKFPLFFNEDGSEKIGFAPLKSLASIEVLDIDSTTVEDAGFWDAIRNSSLRGWFVT